MNKNLGLALAEGFKNGKWVGPALKVAGITCTVLGKVIDTKQNLDFIDQCVEAKVAKKFATDEVEKVVGEVVN